MSMKFDEMKRTSSTCVLLLHHPRQDLRKPAREWAMTMSSSVRCASVGAYVVKIIVLLVT